MGSWVAAISYLNGKLGGREAATSMGNWVGGQQLPEGAAGWEGSSYLNGKLGSSCQLPEWEAV